MKATRSARLAGVAHSEPHGVPSADFNKTRAAICNMLEPASARPMPLPDRQPILTSMWILPAEAVRPYSAQYAVERTTEQREDRHYDSIEHLHFGQPSEEPDCPVMRGCGFAKFCSRQRTAQCGAAVTVPRSLSGKF